MKKLISLLLIASSLFFVSCKSKDDGGFYLNEDGKFTVINFADTQFDSPSDLDSGKLLRELIDKAIKESEPDLITFSGDNAWGTSTLSCYRKLCAIMDGYEIPYYFTFGNHDTESVTEFNIADVVEESMYGNLPLGPEEIHGRSNYVIDIKNKKKKVIHSIYMMDSGSYFENDKSEIEYVKNPVNGFIYNKEANLYYFGNPNYDNVKGNQIDWYKEEVSKRNNESTVIMHIPFLEYNYAFEDYLRAKNTQNIEALKKYDPIGKCNMYEACSSSTTNFGFFDAIKECGSTKNVIVGHDHVNDYSIKYKGIRLTYALKTGDECYWREDGSVCGYTKLVIDEKGTASLSQNYINPLSH